jgi:hypothetical protein
MLNPMTGRHVSAQFHILFNDDFSTIDDIHLPGQMTKPSQWKDLCNASNDSFVKEKKTIDNMWPTFDPKELFVDYYEPTVDSSDAPAAHRVMFDDQIATVAPSKGATMETSEGAVPTPSDRAVFHPPKMLPEILQPIQTRQSCHVPKPVSRLVAGCLVMLVIPSQCNPILIPPLFALAATKANKDTRTYWQALKELNKPQFVKAMQKEIDAHTTNMRWERMPEAQLTRQTKHSKQSGP